MADRKEAERLWAKIVELEKLPCRNEEEFNHKKREMASLQAAYARASGTSASANNYIENEMKGDLKAFGETVKGRPSENLTADDLEQSNRPPGYKPETGGFGR